MRSWSGNGAIPAFRVRAPSFQSRCAVISEYVRDPHLSTWAFSEYIFQARHGVCDRTKKPFITGAMVVTISLCSPPHTSKYCLLTLPRDCPSRTPLTALVISRAELGSEHWIQLESCHAFGSSKSECMRLSSRSHRWYWQHQSWLLG